MNNELKEALKKAFEAGRTVEHYKGDHVLMDLDIDDHTSAKWDTFDEWYDTLNHEAFEDKEKEPVTRQRSFGGVSTGNAWRHNNPDLVE